MTARTDSSAAIGWSEGQENLKTLTPGMLVGSICAEETRLVSAPGSPDPVILRYRYWRRRDILAKSLFWSFMAKESGWLTPKIWPDPRRKRQESPRRREEEVPILLQNPCLFTFWSTTSQNKAQRGIFLMLHKAATCPKTPNTQTRNTSVVPCVFFSRLTGSCVNL